MRRKIDYEMVKKEFDERGTFFYPKNITTTLKNYNIYVRSIQIKGRKKLLLLVLLVGVDADIVLKEKERHKKIMLRSYLLKSQIQRQLENMFL